MTMRLAWRRRLAAWCLALLAALPATAQDFKGPVTLVVGYPAGGSADASARILADKLPALIGQPVLVDNRAGAGGQIAARHVKGAPADGTVLFFTNGHTVVTLPLAMKQPGFDTLADFRPVAPFTRFDLVLAAHPKTQASTLKELLAWFDKHPAERNVGVPGAASAPEFIVLRLAQLTRSDLRPIAYRGSAPATQDVVGGQVAAAVLPVADVLPYQRAGRLRAVAVTQASPLLPGVPAFADIGLGEFADSDFHAVYAPAATPEAVVQRLNDAIRRVLAQPDVVKRIQALAMLPAPGSPRDLAALHAQSTRTIGGLIKAVDFRPQ